MADNYIANPGSGGKTFASDQIGGVDWPRVKPAVGPDGTAVDVSTANPMPVRAYEAGDPQISYQTDSAIAAGSSTTLDSANINSGKTGHLSRLVAASTVPIKVEVRLLENGVASANKAVWVAWDGSWDFAPGRDYLQVAYVAGSDAFRVVITNLDTSRAADVYATFYYDEV